MQARQHRCAAMGCEQMIPQDRLMCLAHWKMVPDCVQAEVRRTYRGRRDNETEITREWWAAYHKAVVAVYNREHGTHFSCVPDCCEHAQAQGNGDQAGGGKP